jgi:hypothetical protein
MKTQHASVQRGLAVSLRVKPIKEGLLHVSGDKQNLKTLKLHRTELDL